MDNETILRNALKDLIRQIEEFAEKHGEYDFYSGDALEALEKTAKTAASAG